MNVYYKPRIFKLSGKWNVRVSALLDDIGPIHSLTWYDTWGEALSAALAYIKDQSEAMTEEAF